MRRVLLMGLLAGMTVSAAADAAADEKPAPAADRPGGLAVLLGCPDAKTAIELGREGVHAQRVGKVSGQNIAAYRRDFVYEKVSVQICGDVGCFRAQVYYPEIVDGVVLGLQKVTHHFFLSVFGDVDCRDPDPRFFEAVHIHFKRSLGDRHHRHRNRGEQLRTALPGGGEHRR